MVFFKKKKLNEKNIGATEKAFALKRKAYEPTKKNTGFSMKHKNQRKSIGFIMQSIGKQQQKHLIFI